MYNIYTLYICIIHIEYLHAFFNNTVNHKDKITIDYNELVIELEINLKNTFSVK